MTFIKKYFYKKNAAFYVVLGVAAASLIVAIAYGATWLKGSESVGTLVLMLIGAAAFSCLSYISPKLGATAMTACNLLALALYINASYTAIFNKAISGLNLADPEVMKIIVFAVLIVVLCIAANVFVWIRMTKKPEPAKDDVAKPMEINESVFAESEAEAETAAQNTEIDTARIIAAQENTQANQSVAVDAEFDTAAAKDEEPVIKPKPQRRKLTPQERAELHAQRAQSDIKRAEEAEIRANKPRERAEMLKVRAEKETQKAQLFAEKAEVNNTVDKEIEGNESKNR